MGEGGRKTGLRSAAFPDAVTRVSAGIHVSRRDAFSGCKEEGVANESQSQSRRRGKEKSFRLTDGVVPFWAAPRCALVVVQDVAARAACCDGGRGTSCDGAEGGGAVLADAVCASAKGVSVSSRRKGKGEGRTFVAVVAAWAACDADDGVYGGEVRGNRGE